jgi:hypothetical protein
MTEAVAETVDDAENDTDCDGEAVKVGDAVNVGDAENVRDTVTVGDAVDVREAVNVDDAVNVRDTDVVLEKLTLDVTVAVNVFVKLIVAEFENVAGYKSISHRKRIEAFNGASFKRFVRSFVVEEKYALLTVQASSACTSAKA